MSNGAVPSITFGKCPRCNNGGSDYPTPGTADAPARDLTGNGYELKQYKGQFLCPTCLIEVKDLEDADIETPKHEATARFLAQAGFQKTITP
jgi:hypothetical protein